MPPGRPPFGRLQGVAPQELAARVDWALDAAALADRADEPVRQFSGGMKRRLNIACGVIHRPRVVLPDEPTVGVARLAAACSPAA